MRISLKLQSNQLKLPVQYEYILQGLIYRSLSNPKLSTFLHEQGYNYFKRSFKMFTFSKLFGKCSYNPQDKTLTFNGDIKWYISSALSEFIHDLGQAFLLESYLELNGQTIYIKELKYENTVIEKTSCRINMLSPITIASTFEADNGRKITQYYSPYDVVFSPLIENNLKRKYYALTNKLCEDDFEIKPVSVTRRDKVVTRFKGTIINAWGGTYELQSSPELLTFAYKVGLGSRNSAGFGLFELV